MCLCVSISGLNKFPAISEFEISNFLNTMSFIGKTLLSGNILDLLLVCVDRFNKHYVIEFLHVK